MKFTQLLHCGRRVAKVRLRIIVLVPIGRVNAGIILPPVVRNVKERGLMRRVVVLQGAHITFLDSVSEVQEEDTGSILITGSHAGENVSAFALRFAFRAAFFNDAGGGKDDAGVVGLGVLSKQGLPAGAVSNMTARIGNAADSWANGRLSYLNQAALSLGLRIGEPLQLSVTRIFGSSMTV